MPTYGSRTALWRNITHFLPHCWASVRDSLLLHSSILPKQWPVCVCVCVCKKARVPRGSAMQPCHVHSSLLPLCVLPSNTEERHSLWYQIYRVCRAHTPFSTQSLITKTRQGGRGQAKSLALSVNKAIAVTSNGVWSYRAPTLYLVNSTHVPHNSH